MCGYEFLTKENLIVITCLVLLFLIVLDALLRYLNGRRPDETGEYYSDQIFPWKFLARKFFL